MGTAFTSPILVEALGYLYAATIGESQDIIWFLIKGRHNAANVFFFFAESETRVDAFIGCVLASPHTDFRLLNKCEEAALETVYTASE